MSNAPTKFDPALNRAQWEIDRGSVALVNVKTDDRARASHDDVDPICHLSIADATSERSRAY